MPMPGHNSGLSPSLFSFNSLIKANNSASYPSNHSIKDVANNFLGPNGRGVGRSARLGGEADHAGSAVAANIWKCVFNNIFKGVQRALPLEAISFSTKHWLKPCYFGTNLQISAKYWGGGAAPRPRFLCPCIPLGDHHWQAITYHRVHYIEFPGSYHIGHYIEFPGSYHRMHYTEFPGSYHRVHWVPRFLP